jgi:hypothetical protein
MSESTVASQNTNSQKHTISSGSKEIVTKKEAELFFDPVTQDFVIVNPSELGPVIKDVNSFDAFKPYMTAFLPAKKANEKEQAALIKAVLAVMKDFIDAKDDTESEKIIKELDKRIKENKDEILKSGNIAKGNKIKNGEIKEYYWASGNKMVRIRSTKIKEHWRTYKLDTKKYKDDLEKTKNEKEKKTDTKSTSNRLWNYVKKPEKESEVKLFEKVFFDKGNQVYSLGNTNFFEACDQIDAGLGAQFLRYSTEASVGSVIDWKNHKVKVSGKIDGTAALLQGKGHFTLFLPEYDGIDVWATLRKIDPKFVKSTAKPLYLMLKINIAGSGFVGVCASLGTEIGVNVGQWTEKDAKEKDKAEAKAGASLDLFAGAKASAEISGAGCMKIVDDKNIAQQATWDELGSVSWGAYAAAGIGVTIGFKVGYWESRFRYEAAIGVVLKLGAGTSIKGTIAPINIGKFLYTVAVSVDWLHLSDIFEGKVHDLFQSIMMNCLYSEQTVSDVVNEMYDHLPQIMSVGAEYMEKTLYVFQTIDRNLEHYIPGYSGYRNNNAAFWLLKKTYHILKQVNTAEHIKDNAITQTIEINKGNRWQYATWQIKVNLISDMTQGMSIMSKYSDSDRQNSMFSIFSSARNSAEFRKIYMCIANADTLFSDSRKNDFEQLKSKFK